MSPTGVTIETLADPREYTPQQLRLAFRVAHALDRGAFVLVEPPAR